MAGLVIALFSSNHFDRNTITAAKNVLERMLNSTDSGDAKFKIKMVLDHD